MENIENKEYTKNKKKYTIYENDLKFKNLRNIDPELAIWHTDELKEKYEKNFDNIGARLKMCKENDFTYLDLSRLELEKIPNLNRYVYFDELKKVKYLFLNDNKLSECGDRLEYFPNLEVLDVSFNKITNITFLPQKLKEFVCNNNELKSIPSHKLIETLDCMCNKIENIGEYANLKDLNCTNNKLKIIKSLNSLKRLICRENPITLIMSQQSLEQLDCSETKIVGEIDGFPKLTGLICNFTSITSISALVNLESLEIINCKMNVPFLPKLTYLLCNNYTASNTVSNTASSNKPEEFIMLSNKYKIKNVIAEGSSMCIIFSH